METETCSSEPQLQRPDKSRDDDRDNIAKTSWQDVRGECSGRQWGMCTIGCMYREQVDGPGGYDDTAMAVEQPSRASEVQQQQSTSPRRSRSRSACWYAKRARAAAEGGRHRDHDAQQHVQAQPEARVRCFGARGEVAEQPGRVLAQQRVGGATRGLLGPDPGFARAAQRVGLGDHHVAGDELIADRRREAAADDAPSAN